ncbi:MAG: ShlB/FhaC/HecB family hemolysin secretion/activation protein [Acidithiobacillus ferrooxidans]|nr:ShlB/FhaC/HecB family hemolysin secretion/activation protein [Acidithiobacillus ferrooxidans]MDD5002619.1 ShlB/FhaC/HecB family hemolysin secretion/activation protein [Acidithiobacillus sp.]MDD5379140.1 ShlB/FhaC/HecB family hemolysin secretion/activation protein [Acidithiobacillus sp.]MDD5575515.1 ShlB/FhaC/HecB family hemolysin secretion/activation protein [Acidithiobacillus sp.]
MLDNFSPPPTKPTVIERSAPLSAPLVVQSHGYRYTVDGNTLLPMEALRLRLLTASDPSMAVHALEAAYRQVGYPLVAVRANVSGKTVSVTIIEGVINALKAPSGLRSFYTGLLYQQGLSNAALIRRNILAQSYAARSGEQPQVGIQPGQAVGASVLSVQAEPLPKYQPWQLSYTFGNFGSRYSSRYEGITAASLNMGHGVQLHGSFANGFPGLSRETSGSNYADGIFGASIVTPWGIYGADYEALHYRIGAAAAPLYPTGNIHRLSVTGTQLAFADTDTRFAVAESWNQIINTVTAYNGFYRLTDQRYQYLDLSATLSQSFQAQGMPATMSGSFGISKGISPHRGTLSQSAPYLPSPRFLLYHWNLAYQQTLPLGMTVTAGFNGQWAENVLPSYNQWILGGMGNLSAYYPGIISGDSGYLGRFSLNGPAWRWRWFSADLNMAYAWGAAHNSYTPIGQPYWMGLGDLSLGLNLATDFGTSVRLVGAIPAGSVSVSKALRDSYHNDIYFSITQSF